MLVATIALAGCAGEPGDPIFGTADTTCTSVVLSNDDGDEQILNRAVDCLFGEIEAGNVITVDFSIPTVDGDPIYYRYAYDGDTVLTVQDNRADEFGAPTILAQQCKSLERTDWTPEGTDCVGIAHDGFPEARR